MVLIELILDRFSSVNLAICISAFQLSCDNLFPINVDGGTASAEHMEATWRGFVMNKLVPLSSCVGLVFY